MESVEFTRGKALLDKAAHTRTVIAIVQCIAPKLPFNESVYFFDLVADKLDQLYGQKQIIERGE